MLRNVLSLSLLALFAPTFTPTVQGADLAAGVTPLALQSMAPAAPCPTAAEANGSLHAAASRVAAGPHGSFWASFEGAATYGLSIATTVAVCDPAMASARRVPGPITGSAANPPTDDTVGYGLRMLGAPITELAAAARVGDRFVLPAVGAGSTVDVVVRTATGASPVRLGPFTSVPVAVKVAGTMQAPAAVVELADGTTAQAAVPAPRAVAPKLTVKIKKNRLKLRMTGAPGAILTASQAPSPTDVRLIGYDPNGVVSVANAKGVATGVVSDLRRAKFVLVGIVDGDRREFTPLTCTLRWKGRTLRRAACRPTTAAEQARRIPARQAQPLPDELANLRNRLEAGAARLQQATAASSGPRPTAHAAAATAQVPIDTTVVTRLRGRALIEFSDEDLPLVGDVNGDGRPDFGIGGDLLGKPKLALSTASGWSRVPLLVDDPSQAMVLPDLTGDGIDDFSLYRQDTVVAGSRAWSTSLPAAIDLRQGPALSSGGFSVAPSTDRLEGAGLPFPLPDATGDGRPELGLSPLEGQGFAVFASESLPLGRASALPVVRTRSFAEDLAAVRSAGADDDEGEDGTQRQAGSDLLATRGGALAWSIAAETRGGNGMAATFSAAITLGAVPTTAPWAPTATVSLRLAGMAKADDYDPVTGETLVTTNLEGCDFKTFTCTARVRRVDAAGNVTATASVRAVGATSVAASFTTDGPDGDDRPDVLLHDAYADANDPIASDVPGVGYTVAMWDSTTPTVDFSALPVLASGGAPLRLAGPLLNWVEPDGGRRHAGYVVAGSGAKRTQTLTLLGARR